MTLITRSACTNLASICRSLASSLRQTPVLLFVLGIVFCSVSSAQTAHFSGTQSTVASSLNYPYGVAADGIGNVYIADTYNDRVLKETLSAGGIYIESTVASGLGRPYGVAADSIGNVYIADTNNNRVLKETWTGSAYTQSTVGSGLNRPRGVAVDATGNLYIADTNNNLVLKETLSGGVYTQSTIASGLNSPQGIAVDGSGNVYIADTGDSQVLKETWTGSGYTQSTLGNGLNGPCGVAVDGSGNLYILDYNHYKVVKVPWTGSAYGTQSTVASASLFAAAGVGVDGSGNLYIADTDNMRVVKQTFSGVDFATASVGSTSLPVTLFFVFDTAGTLGRTAVLTQGVAGLDFADAGKGSCAATDYAAGDTCKVNVTFNPKFAGARLGAVVLQNGSGSAIATGYVHGIGTGPQAIFEPGTRKMVLDNIPYPYGVDVDGAGNVYIVDSTHSSVVRVAPDGSQTMIGAGLNPSDVAVDGAGNVYAVANLSSVAQLRPDGTQTTVSTDVAEPHGVAVDGAGNVYIVDTFNHRVVKVTPNGVQSTVPAIGLGLPSRVTVDAAGNVYIADTSNNRVVKVTPGGTQTTITNDLLHPQGLTVEASGDVYIADMDNNRVVKVTPWGTQTAIGAGIWGPIDVALDGAGNLYIANGYLSNVVEVTRAQQSLSFASTLVGSTSYDSPQSMTVRNIGNMPLTFLGAAYPADFPESGSSDCLVSTPLAAGASCPLTINFTPTIVGNLSETVMLSDDSLNAASTQSVGVSGYGNTPPPPLQTTPLIEWLTAPTINYGTDLTAILNATAHDSSTGEPILGTFSYTAVLVGGSAPVAVRAGTILNPGTYELTVTITPQDTVHYTTGTTWDELTVNGTFGAAPVGGKSPATMTLTFAMHATTLGIPHVLTQGAPGLDFTDAGTGSCTLNGPDYMYNQGDTCTVNVSFTPTAPGARNGAVALYDAQSKVVDGKFIAGIGVGPAIAFGPGVITTLAGNGTAGYTGDGGAATSAQLNLPGGLALDGAGNLYVAEYGNSTIRMVTPQGVISTLAGTGVAGYNGDGPAAGAQLNQPSGLAVDGSGELLIANYGDGSLRVVDPVTQTLITIFEPGMFNHPTGFATDGGGGLYLSLAWDNLVIENDMIVGTGEPGYSGDNGPAGQAQLNFPTGLAVDGAGNLYIADSKNNVVRMVNTTGIISTVAGSANSQSAPCSGDGGLAINADLRGPGGVTVDAAGNLYISDYFCGRIRKVTPAGIITSVAGVGIPGDGNPIYGGDNGPATSAKLNLPAGVVVDGKGNLYIADSGNFRVRKVDVSDAPSLAFPDTQVGSASAAQDVALANVGNAPLNISQISTASNFTLQGAHTSCGTSGQLLDAAASCILGVEFAPQAAGANQGNVLLTNNTPSASHALLLSGTGLIPPQTITFAGPGNQTFGVAPIMLTAWASSSLPVSYTVTSGSATVSGNTLTITGAGSVTVQATQAGNDSYAAATPVSVTFTVTQGTLVVNWAAPAAITYGTTLSGAQLNATSGGVAGTFVYTPAAGSTPATGEDTLSVTFTPSDGTDYVPVTQTVLLTVNRATPFITWTTPAAITHGTALSDTQLNATSGGVAGSFVYTPAAGSTPAIGANTLAVTFTPSDGANYTAAAQTVSLAVGKATTTTTVQTSALTVLLQSTVTLTAFVSSPAGTPVGSVSFMDGSTALGTATLDNTGTATLTISTLNIGPHSITAVYAGNVDFAGSASSALTETVQDFNFSVSGTITTAVSATVLQGNAAVYTLQISPTSGSTFASAVALTLTGLPAGATYTITPSAVSAGSHSTIITVTINTTKTSASSSSPKGIAFPKSLLLAIFLPLLGTRKLRRALRSQMKASMLMVVMFGVLVVTGMSACGGGHSATPTQIYPMTLTATSGAMHHSVTLNLTIQ